MTAADRFTPQWLLQELARLLPGFPAATPLCVAFSGGVDSTALLGALAQGGAGGAAVRAVYVDHGLSGASPQWALHCRQVAATLKLPLTVLSVAVPRSRGTSLEAQAREVRYASLAACLAPGEVLLTAHNQDDQLETVLLQLLRGAGVAGLAAMPAVAPFAPGTLARPLLTRTRVQLAGFVAREDLPYVEDGSNANLAFDRNYLRHRVLPAIRERWPGAAGTVARAARHAAEAQLLLTELARRDVERARVGASLSVAVLRALPPARRRNALRHWITSAGHLPPDERRLLQLAGPVIDARPDANPQVHWGGTAVRRHAGRLTLGAARPGAVTRAAAGWGPVTWEWGQARSCVLEGGGALWLTPDPCGPVSLAALPAQLLVRARAGGERLTPVRGGARRAVKSLLQEARVPLADRDTLPLIFAAGSLVAVADLWLDESVQAQASTPLRGRFRWARPSP
jgi:tRNA(Ile)-lysidine synthase